MLYTLQLVTLSNQQFRDIPSLQKPNYILLEPVANGEKTLVVQGQIQEGGPGGQDPPPLLSNMFG